MPAIIEKVEYLTQAGQEVAVRRGVVHRGEGRLGGEDVTIERPIEFFIPTGQRDESQQWITSTMRPLSLAARGGFVARKLQDMRKVSWDRGQVRLGDVQRLDGHRSPRWHDSEVAALAYAIQQILFRRGFLDAEGNQVPSRMLARLPRGQMRAETALPARISASARIRAKPKPARCNRRSPACYQDCIQCWGANAGRAARTP